LDRRARRQQERGVEKIREPGAGQKSRTSSSRAVNTANDRRHRSLPSFPPRASTGRAKDLGATSQHWSGWVWTSVR
jgi:hypothetical protein